MNNGTLIIAEAGVNHNGDLTLAKKLIDCAADAGVDYVKFQTFKAEKLVSKNATKADYQQSNMQDGDTSQFNMLKKLELNDSMHDELIAHCKLRNVRFLSTPFDEESIVLLQKHNIRLGKIPSGEITNLPYLRAMARAFPEIIISTGMSEMKEIEEAVAVLCNNGTLKENITILHCNTEYPTPMGDVNLRAMNTIGETLGIAVGYSDHTLGIEVPIAAVALGATVIEKHFTLDRNMPGPDHAASLEPGELKKMIESIRNIEKAISGSGVKEPSASESKNKAIARKSIHLKTALKAGHILAEEDFEMKRPGDGISPMRLDAVVGKAVLLDLPQEHKLSFNDLG
ncbi:MAG: N-acetylneuraminate synthase [Sediminibacterium sp.]